MDGNVSWNGNSSIGYSNLINNIVYKQELQEIKVKYLDGPSLDTKIVFYPNLGLCKEISSYDIHKDISIAFEEKYLTENNYVKVVTADKRTRTYFSMDHNSNFGDELKIRY